MITIPLTRKEIRPRLILLSGRVESKTAKPALIRAKLKLNDAITWSMGRGDNDHISILRGHASEIMQIASTLPVSSVTRQEIEHMVLEANTKEVSAMMQEAFNRELQ